nr:hypothetical protein [Castellaniella sp.]
MRVNSFARRGSLLCIVAVLSGCSWGGDTSASAGPCRVNPASCMFDGAYEPGERDYAELEARRLNQAQAERLRRLKF